MGVSGSQPKKRHYAPENTGYNMRRYGEFIIHYFIILYNHIWYYFNYYLTDYILSIYYILYIKKKIIKYFRFISTYTKNDSSIDESKMVLMDLLYKTF